jgi:hypothetical protein
MGVDVTDRLGTDNNAVRGQLIRKIIEDDPEFARHCHLKPDYVKMSDWHSRHGAVFACDNQSGHLWVLDTPELRELMTRVEATLYPSSQLRRKVGAGGRRQYGRHSGLSLIGELSEADLIRFEPRSSAEAARVLSLLRSPVG